MSEQFVQVPVSLIERIREELWFSNSRFDLEALLSQPTPTAGPCAQCGGARFIDTGRTSGNYSVGTPCPSCNAAPPSIADMVPGTTFRARMRGGSAEGDEWKVGRFGSLAVRLWTPGFDDRVDPSTIRDVEVPE